MRSCVYSDAFEVLLKEIDPRLVPDMFIISNGENDLKEESYARECTWRILRAGSSKMRSMWNLSCFWFLVKKESYQSQSQKFDGKGLDSSVLMKRIQATS